MRKNHLALVTAVLTLSLISLACAFAGDLLAGRQAAPESSPPTENQPVVPQDSLQESLQEATPAAPEAQITETDIPGFPATALTPESEPTETPQSPGESLPGPDCEQQVCFYQAAFPLQRPIAEPGRVTIDPTLRFGTYLRSLKSAFHGVSFINSSGTPVVAAAEGTVVFAGDDQQTVQSVYKDYYGSLVILEHSLPALNEPVYTLYGHLSEVQVAPGEQVSAGQQIGLVGNSGDISGSALHFEVRVGENNYSAVRNPELWVKPLPAENGEPTGVLAGRVLDEQGNYVALENIVIEQLAGPGLPAQDTFYLKTYAEDRLKGDPPFAESFALGGLPAGDYQISFYYGPDIIQREVPVRAGQVSVVTIQVP